MYHKIDNIKLGATEVKIKGHFGVVARKVVGAASVPLFFVC